MASKKDLFKVNVDAYNTKESVEHYGNLTVVKPVEKFLIDKYFKGKILDLGCGCGRTTQYLHKEGFDVIGVDIAEDMITKAKELYPDIRFEVGNACKLNFKDGEFDVVFFSFNGLDYIYPESKRVDALKEIDRVLKKGGLFVYSSHNPLSMFFKLRPGLMARSLKEGKLFSRYKPEKNINFGTVYTYFGTKKRQRRLAENNTNLKMVSVVPNSVKEIHPHYVFMKSSISKDSL